MLFRTLTEVVLLPVVLIYFVSSANCEAQYSDYKLLNSVSQTATGISFNDCISGCLNSSTCAAVTYCSGSPSICNRTNCASLQLTQQTSCETVVLRKYTFWFLNFHHGTVPFKPKPIAFWWFFSRLHFHLQHIFIKISFGVYYVKKP